MGTVAPRTKALGATGLVVLVVGGAFMLSGIVSPTYPFLEVGTTPQYISKGHVSRATFTAIGTGHYWPELLLNGRTAKTKNNLFSQCIAKGDEDTASKIVAQAATWQVWSGGKRVALLTWRHYFSEPDRYNTVIYAVGAFPTVRGEQYRVEVRPLAGVRELEPLNPRLRVEADPLDVKDIEVWAGLRFLFGAFLALVGLILLTTFAVIRRRTHASEERFPYEQ
jgi:hypothetical protein